MSKVKNPKVTPLMKQYFDMKAKHKDALLLFRVGDFYETFGEDAIKASEVLGIVLTARNNGGSNIELAGFPHHSLDVYLPKLVQGGFRVAVCEQLEKPSKEKKIVKRGVTDVVTPGVGIHDNLLEQKENTYLASFVLQGQDQAGTSFLDLSTGDFTLFQGDQSEVIKLINTYNPKEIIFSKKDRHFVDENLSHQFYTYGLDEWIWQYDYCREQLLDQFKVNNLKGFGIEQQGLGQIAAGSILHYLKDSEQHQLGHINKLNKIKLDSYVWLDQFTIRNLELIRSNHPSGVPLIDILDLTSNPMGARLLRKWIMLPLTDIEEINSRLDSVSYLLEDQSHVDYLTEFMKSTSDLERIIGKIALRRVNPREIVALKNSLLQLPTLKSEFTNCSDEAFSKRLHKLRPLPAVSKKIKNAISDSPAINTSKGGVIADGYNGDLDELRGLISNSKEYLNELLQLEISQTGIANLKVGFNNVFGYYFEVTNKYKNQGLIPEHWTRKQTLTNAERYISEELKTLESKILGAEEKIINLENQLFNELVEWLQDYIKPIQKNALLLAELDCLNSFARLAERNKYCKPHVSTDFDIQIEQGRHPVIEAHLPLGESYIPNDLWIDNNKEQVLLITGPNMSGKSAILRQTALICLMAQMGSYVPAERASIGIVDRIFTRVGASDNISSGESTFMVEMTETSSILNNLSKRSLILLDEIGRGTSTYDGISIAWSIVEYLHESRFQPKTLFATHYHELSQLSEKYDRIFNYNVTTQEYDDRIIFLRKLERGSTNQSFGIQVAQMSGLPKTVVDRANQILKMLQDKSVVANTADRTQLDKLEHHDFDNQLLMFAADPISEEVAKDLLALDINSMTPIDCMLKLKALVQKVKEIKK